MNKDDDAVRGAAHHHIAEGRPAEALQLYREGYRAARESPAAAGARSSRWLSDWAELARTYPPALEALREQRLDAVQRLNGAPGNPTPSRGLAALDDFTEVTIISTRLGEPDYPVDLFAHLDARRPETAGDCAAQARRLLVRAGRFDLARRYLGDPLEVIARIAAVFEQRLTRGFTYAPEEMRQILRARTVEDYLSGVREVIAVLTGVGDHELAEQVRHQAASAVHWGHVREDVEAALMSDEAS